MLHQCILQGGPSSGMGLLNSTSELRKCSQHPWRDILGDFDYDGENEIHSTPGFQMVHLPFNTSRQDWDSFENLVFLLRLTDMRFKMRFRPLVDPKNMSLLNWKVNALRLVQGGAKPNIYPFCSWICFLFGSFWGSSILVSLFAGTTGSSFLILPAKFTLCPRINVYTPWKPHVVCGVSKSKKRSPWFIDMLPATPLGNIKNISQKTVETFQSFSG